MLTKIARAFWTLFLAAFLLFCMWVIMSLAFVLGPQ